MLQARRFAGIRRTLRENEARVRSARPGRHPLIASLDRPVFRPFLGLPLASYGADLSELTLPDWPLARDII